MENFKTKENMIRVAQEMFRITVRPGETELNLLTDMPVAAKQHITRGWDQKSKYTFVKSNNITEDDVEFDFFNFTDKKTKADELEDTIKSEITTLFVKHIVSENFNKLFERYFQVLQPQKWQEIVSKVEGDYEFSDYWMSVVYKWRKSDDVEVIEEKIKDVPTLGNGYTKELYKVVVTLKAPVVVRK